MQEIEMELVATQKLKSKGIKSTPQRKIILAYLMNSNEHPSIDMIYSYATKNGLKLSLATVYNTLEILQKHNLIIEVATDQKGKTRYDYFEKTHYHVICIKCNRIVDVFDDQYQLLEEQAKKATNYKVLSSQYEVYGICGECQKKME